jgi:hypothetical protein
MLNDATVTSHVVVSVLISRRHHRLGTHWIGAAFVASLLLSIAPQAKAQTSASITLRNIRALGITSDSRHLVTLDSRGSVLRHSLPEGNPVTSSPTVAIPRASRLSTDVEFALGIQSIWNVSDGSLLREFTAFESLTMSRDYALAAGWKRMSQNLTLLDVGSNSTISTLPGDERQEFEQAAISPDGRYVVTGHHQGLVKQWDLSSGLPVRELGDLQHQRVSVIAFSPDGKRVVAGSNNTFRDQPILSMWDASNGYFDKGFVAPGNDNSPSSLAFSADGHWLISGHSHGRVIVWDTFSGEVACELKDFGYSNIGPIAEVGLSPDSTYAFARQSEFARVWSIRSCLARYLHRGEVAKALQTSPLFAPKGEFETSEQFQMRQEQARTFETELLDRLGSRLEEELRSTARTVDQKMAGSTTTVALKVQSVGQYNADRQVFPVTIDGVTEIMNVPIAEAAEFKGRYASAKVAGKKRLQRDLTRYELFDVSVVHPTTGSKYFFGRQEGRPLTKDSYAPRTAAELKQLVDSERAITQKYVRGALQPLETTECTEGDVALPLDVEAVFVLAPTRDCWTPWLVVGGHSVSLMESGNLLVQFAYNDGTTAEAVEDGPKKSINIDKPVAKVRFKSLGREPVTVTYKIR